VTSGRVVVVASVVVGAIVVVDLVVEVDVEFVISGLVVDSATSVVTAEALVAPCADPDEQAEATSSRANAPATTLVRRKGDISSKYPLCRTKCWRPHKRVFCFSV